MATRNHRLILDILVATSLIALIIFARLLPHLPNFTPVAAIALFSAFFFRHRPWAASLPLIGMIISDFFLPHYAWHQRLVVYSAFLLTFFLGFFLRKKYTVTRTITASIIASLIFYLITNCVFLYHGPGPVMYPHTPAGQLSSYMNALPFLKWSLLGDLTYSLALFIAYHYLTRLSLSGLSRQSSNNPSPSF